MSEFWQGMALQGLSMLGQGYRNRTQMNQQMRLMNMQHGHQQELNRQGHELQHQMWKKTNFPAQVKMLEKAGLNPALLYGMGGAGGSTTGSQTGGSAVGGSAPQAPPMDMSNILLGAQIDDIKASARLKNTEADKKEGVDTDLAKSYIDKTYAEIDKLIADTKNVETQTALTEINIRIAEIEEIYKPDLYEKNIELMSAQVRRLIAQADIDERSVSQIVSNLTADYWLKQSESQKNWSMKFLTDKQTEKVQAEIDIAFQQIDINWQSLDEEKKRTLLQDLDQQLRLKLKEMDISFAEKKLLVDSIMNTVNNIIGTVGQVAGAGMGRGGKFNR